jgi:hypothetical protein
MSQKAVDCLGEWLNQLADEIINGSAIRSSANKA